MLVIPAGGCGEFGKNLTVYVNGGVVLIADCGIQMPDDLTPGVEHLIPDFEPIVSRYGPPTAVLLTHGHEDHIGALGYLLRHVDAPVPVYGRPLTLRLAERRLDRMGVPAALRDLRDFVANQPVYFSPLGEGGMEGARMVVTPLAMPHSIPESCALLIESLPSAESPEEPRRRVLHTGDYKLDEMGEFAYAALEQAPVDLLVGDSTNAQVPGKTACEHESSRALEALLQDPLRRGRIVVALFSSHLDRVARFAEACRRARRRLCLLGRGLQDAVTAAERARVLSLPADVMVAPEQAGSLPPSQLAILCTGTQGERAAALGRLVSALDRGVPAPFGSLRLGRGDTVVVSARIIPGHERPVGRLLDQLLLAGIEVMTGAPYAVSGHGSREDLCALFRAARPRAVLPVHGTQRQLHAHAALAEEMGIPALRCQDGDVVCIDDQIEITDRIESGSLCVEGGTIGEVGRETLQTRLRLSYTGVVAVAADPRGRGRFLVQAVGVRDSGPGLAALCSEAAEGAAAALRLLSDGELPSWPRLSSDECDAVVRAVRQIFHRRRGIKPAVLPVLPEGETRYDEGAIPPSEMAESRFE